MFNYNPTTKMKNEKMLVEFRGSEYSSLENRIKALYPSFQAIGKELSECGIDHSEIDLQSLVSDPRAALMKFLPVEFQSVAKFVAQGALHFPTTFDEVIKTVEQAKLSRGHDLLTYAPYYVIKQDGEAMMVHSKFEALKESCTIYTANEIENKRLALAQEICDALTAYQELAGELRVERFSISGMDYTLSKVVQMQMTGNNDNVKFKPVTSFVKKT